MSTVIVAAATTILICTAPLYGGSRNAPEKVAYIQNREIYVALGPLASPQQLTNDGIVKFNLRWNPDGRKIAYIEKTPEDIAKGRLVVIDPDGKKLIETLIHEGGPSKVGGFRFIEEVSWHGNNHIGLYGSVNPYTCEYIVLDASTAARVTRGIGDCGSFSVSPDGQHLAHRDIVGPIAAESARLDEIVVDGKVVFPAVTPGKGRVIRVLTEPVWSSDGTQIAFIETHSATGQTAIVVLGGKEWQNKRQALPQDQSDNIRIAWFGKDVVVASERIAVTYDPAVDRMRLATPEETTHVRAPDAAEVRAKALRDEAKAKAESRHWQEADIWRPEQ